MLWGEAGCWMCLSQEAPAKGGGSGRVPKELGCRWDWGISELGTENEKGALGGQGGEWVDICPRRKAEISFFPKALGKTLVFPTSTLIPPPAWADRALHLLSCCLTAQLSAHILLPDFREKTLCFIYIKRTGSFSQPTGLLLSPWQMALAPATRGTGAGEPGRLETEHHHWFAQASLGCNKWGQKQLPLSKSQVPSPRAQLHCRVFERWWLLFHRGWQQIDSVTAPSVRGLNPPLIDMTYRNGFFGYLSSHCVLRKL